MQDHMGRHFSAHLRNSPYRKQGMDGKNKRPQHEYSGSHEAREGSGGSMEHPKHTHGTAPHPATGVHAVHIHHHEGGRASTHTFHHDQEEPEMRDHANLADAHDHAREMLPPDEGQEHSEPDGDESYANDALGNLGG